MQEQEKTKDQDNYFNDKTLKKFAKMYAIQNDMSLFELVEKALERSW